MPTNVPRLVLVTASTFLLAGAAEKVSAADRFVSVAGSNTGNDCLTSASPCATLVFAITQAASGDVIKATQGVYPEQLSIDYSTTLTLSGAWALDFASRDPVGFPSVLQGSGNIGNDLLSVTAATGDVIDLTLDGFSLNHGHQAVDVSTDDGGSLTMRLQNCRVTKSRYEAVFANSLGASTLDLTISSCTLSGNVVHPSAITVVANESSTVDITLDELLVERNTSQPSLGGGGIFVSGTVGTLTLVGTDLTVAKNRGPGISIGSVGPSLSVSASLANVLVSQNRGGGVAVEGEDTSFTFANGTIERNRVRSPNDGAVGGLSVSAGISATVVNSTIRGNRSSGKFGYVGGMVINSFDGGPVDISNTIIWGNRTTNGPASDLLVGPAGTVNIGYSDIGPGVSGAFNDLGGNLSTDPRFVSGRNNHLMADSPLVDAGTCLGAPAADFEGDPRPTGAGCDIGHDEFVP